MGWHHEHGLALHPQQRLRDRAAQQPLGQPAAVGPDHDEQRVDFVCDLGQRMRRVVLHDPVAPFDAGAGQQGLGLPPFGQQGVC
jgi:hypothetical protein